MRKGIKAILFLLIVSQAVAFSQELSQQVLVPAAGLFSTGTLSLSQTIGEAAVVIFSGSGYTLTQGFQQPSMKITTDNIPKGNGVDVFPNPAIDYISIRLFGDTARKFKIEIINITGIIVETQTISFTTSYFYIHQINIDDLKIGFYFVRVISSDRVINRTFKIEKI